MTEQASTGPVTGLTSVQLQPDPVRWLELIDDDGTERRLGPYTDTRVALRVAMDENRRGRGPGQVRARLAPQTAHATEAEDC